MMKTLEEVTGNIRTGNSAITEDLERQEAERENLWKRLQAARAEGDQVLQSHWEQVHQTSSDRFFDNARAAFQRVKRSMSQRPASSKAVATEPPPQIRKAAVARRHTWEMELVKWRQHALV